MSLEASKICRSLSKKCHFFPPAPSGLATDLLPMCSSCECMYAHHAHRVPYRIVTIIVLALRREVSELLFDHFLLHDDTRYQNF